VSVAPPTRSTSTATRPPSPTLPRWLEHQQPPAPTDGQLTIHDFAEEATRG